jgi:hypothetical protein
MRVYFEVFRSRMSSWQELFQKAADFGSQVGPARLIGFSHSEDQNDGVITVWYWGDDQETAPQTTEQE